MEEIVIRYKNQRVLEVLKDLTKYFDFSIVAPDKKKKVNKTDSINGVTVVLGDPSVNTSDLTDIFTDKGLDAGKIRAEQWRKN